MSPEAVTISIVDRIAEENELPDDLVQEIKEELRRNGQPVQQVFSKIGVVREERVARALAESLNIRFVDLDHVKIPPNALRAVSDELCHEYSLIPILKIHDKLVVAMEDPLDVKAVEQLEFVTGCRVEVVVSTPSQIQKAIDRHYGVQNTIKSLSSSLELPDDGSAEEVEGEELHDDDSSGPVAKIVRLIITQAVHQGASDIHLEPTEHDFRVRIRVDGVLQIMNTFERQFANACVSSIKIMANMDITERRLPQDGRIHLVVEGKPIDLRVSTLPIIDGEKVVMRILDQSSILLELEDLGFSPYDLARLKKVISKPNGIFLVSGPTGSGKTTTLYAILQRLATVTTNITTLEDPIEYRLDKINQSQINVKAGMNFAKGLRAILRQDPDIIMVGEIRDFETAEIAVQAALTGHLVLSTIHTNDAPSSIARLVEMGIEPFLVASSMEGVLAQRLVRKLCPYCKKPYTPEEKVLNWFGLEGDAQVTFHKPVGCRECKRSGYKGRMGIYELLVPTESFRSKVVSFNPDVSLMAEARKDGMRLLVEDGLEKIKQGLTSVEEVMRVAKADF